MRVKITRKAVLCVLALFLLVFAIYSDNAYAKTEIKVTGLKTSIVSETPKSALKDTITIKPKISKYIHYEMYNSKTKKWDVVDYTDVIKDEKFTLKYTKNWQDTYETKWRIRIYQKDGTAVYKSETIKIYNNEAKPKETTVSSLGTFIDPVDTTKEIKDKISVAPFEGRYVSLYFFNEDSQKYELYNKTPIENEKGELQIIYPDLWRDKTLTKWKVTVPKVPYDRENHISPIAGYSAEIQIHNRTKDTFKKTKITDYEKIITKSYKKSVNDTISVTPAYGRTGYLYIYNKTTKKWIKKLTLVTKDKYTSTVKIQYPDIWKAHGTSIWKIDFPAVAENTEKNLKVLPGASVETRLNNDAYSTLGEEKDTDTSFIAGLVMDVSTGKIIFERGENIKRRPASTTKLMTGLILNEYYNNKAISKVTISQKAKDTVYNLYTANYGLYSSNGETLNPDSALYAMLLPSNNLMAESIGVSISGSTDKFAKLMTSRAKELGCTSTAFKDASGLDVDGHYTTVHDMAKIARFILTDKNMPLMRTVCKTWKKKIVSSKRTGTAINTNPFKSDPTCIGMKTGTCYGCSKTTKTNANAAKNCFVGAFTYNDKKYITVVFNAPLGDNAYQKKLYTNKLLEIMKYNVANGITAY